MKTKEEKENAVNMFTCITNIDIGDDQLMENNCRNYVITIATFLKNYPEMKVDDWNDFELEMQTLLSEDNEKFQNITQAAQDYLKKGAKFFSDNLPVSQKHDSAEKKE